MKRMKSIKKIADLTPDPANANRGTERGLGQLENSLRKYGAGRSILTDKHGVVIAGNKTLEQASALGLTIQTVRTKGDALVVVQREDLDLADLDNPTARELAYADNRVGQTSLEWDAEQLQRDLDAGVDLENMFTEGELEALLREAGCGGEKESPEDFPDVDDNIEIQYCCPKCKYEWSGKPK